MAEDHEPISGAQLSRLLVIYPVSTETCGLTPLCLVYLLSLFNEITSSEPGWVGKVKNQGSRDSGVFDLPKKLFAFFTFFFLP